MTNNLHFSATLNVGHTRATYVRPKIDGKLGVICKHLSEMSSMKWGHIEINHTTFAFDLDMFRETGTQTNQEVLNGK